MNRRDFLSRSSQALSGLVLAGVAGLVPGGALAKELAFPEFSIDVITGNPDLAIREMEQVIREAFPKEPVRFQEYRLQGTHMGDIAYTRSRQLIDFRRATDVFSQHLHQAAQTLSLPTRYDHPVLLRFHSERQASAPTNATVFCGDTLVKQLSLQNSDKELYRIEGLKGYVDIAVEHQMVRIAAASCKHQTCMKMGAIGRTGESLVCIPNQISVSIAGNSGLGVDAITF